MRLSEAMRLGAMTTKQAFGRLIASEDEACAVGAALLAAGVGATLASPGELSSREGRDANNKLLGGETVYRLPAEWMPTWNILTVCPECGMHDFVAKLIPHLNDPPHSWTRERIADWVELQEGLPTPEQVGEEIEQAV